MATRIWAPGEFINPGDLRQPRTTPPVVSNQLTNPGFETGDLTGWTVGNAAIVVSTTHKFDGTYALKHPDGLLGVYEVSNNNVVPVLPGQQIRAGVRYFRETNVTGRQTLKVVLRWYNGSMTVIGETEYEQAGGASSVWYDPSVLGTAPADAAYVRFVLYTFQTGTGGSHDQYFDEAFWDYIQPQAPTGLVYKAVQAVGGFTASTEPTWPIVLGNTVVDNEVTWEAVVAASVTWQATPIMKSGGTEPIWPLYVGATILDGTMVWQAVSRRVTDEKCPNTKEVILGASKIFAADQDIIKFSATINPLDWSTPNDAGYLPFGLQLYGSNPVAAMGLYRSNLVAFNAQGFQMWQIDQDPANMAFLDAVPVGSTEHQALQPVANDLMLLNPVGVRDFAIAGASTNLQAGSVGEAIDPLVTAQIKAGTYDAFGLFWPAMGQYWLFFGPQAFVLTISEVKKKSWSRYVFPDAVNDWTLQGNDLYLRAGPKVWKVDDSLTLDDVYTVGNPPVLSGVALGGLNELTWTPVDPEGGSEILYYNLYRSVGPGSTTFAQIGGNFSADDPLEYGDTGPFTTSQTYNYQVVAVDALGNSTAPSNTVALIEATDPLWADVVALVQANSGTLVERTGLPVMTVVGAGAVSPTQSKFGGFSFRNPGTDAQNTNYVLLRDATDSQGLFIFPGEFTLEMWVRTVGYSSADAANMLLASNIGYPGTGSMQWSVEIGIPYHLTWLNGAPDQQVIGATADMPLATWKFIAITRNAANLLRIWEDGAIVASGTVTGQINALTALRSDLGWFRGIDSNHADADCYADQLRVTKVCRYTAPFTPPAGPFPTA